MTKSKILFLITKSNWGGAQKYVYDLSTNLDQTQYEIVVVSGGTGEMGAETGLLFEKLREKNIRTITVKNFTRNVFFFKEFLAFLEVYKIIRQEKPAIIHLNSSKAAGIGALAAKLNKVAKIVYTVHGWPFNESRPGYQKLLIYYLSLLTGWLVDKVIVINQTDLIEGEKMLGLKNKLALIYNGLPSIDFLTKQEARNKLSLIIKKEIEDDQLIIGTIAELHNNKRIDTNIKAVANLDNVLLIIIGGGEKHQELNNLIKQLKLENKVFLTGFVPNAACLIKAFDIFSLISAKEGHPYTILESGQAGVVTVGSNIPGILDIIENKNLLIPVGDVPALKSIYQKLITDPELRNNLGIELKNKIEKKFSLEKMLTETVKIYSN